MRRKLFPVLGLIGMVIVLMLSGCGLFGSSAPATPSPSASPSPTPALSGGILAAFDVQGETYRIFITNEKTIEDVLALRDGKSQATIPNGKLVRGKVAYNSPWSWHIDSEDIQMAEMTAEVSDGLPSHVENNLDYWVDTVGRFSPWSAKLVKVEDYR